MTDPAPLASRRNPVAVVAMVLAVVMTGVMLTSRVLSVALPSLSYRLQLPISALVGVLSALGGAGLLLAIAAAVLGAIGATRPGRPHALGAAALAIGCTAAATSVLNLLSSHLVSGLVTLR